MRIIGLDITVPGEHHGDMTEAAQTCLTPRWRRSPPALLLHHCKPDTGLITYWVLIGELQGPMPFA